MGRKVSNILGPCPPCSINQSPTTIYRDMHKKLKSYWELYKNCRNRMLS